MLFSFQFVLSQYIYLHRQIMPKMMCLCLCLWQHALLCSCLPKSSSLNIFMPLCSRKLNRLNEQAKNKPSHLNGITCYFLKQNNSVNQTACLNHLFVSSFCAANAQDFRTAYLYLKWPLSLSLFLPVCSSHQNKHKNKEKTHKFWLFWGTTIDSAC